MVTSFRKRISDIWTGLVVATLFIAIIGGTIWGIGWSFYRHGVVHGFVAFSVPPYAIYRAAASLWENGPWIDDYDSNTEKIAVLIMQSQNRDAQWQIQARDTTNQVKKWLKTLPVGKRIELENTARTFGEAVVKYSAEIIRDLGEANAASKKAFTESSSESFAAIPAFPKTWNAFKRETEYLLTAFLNEVPDEARANIKSMQISIEGMLRQNVEEVVNDIFGP